LTAYRREASARTPQSSNFRVRDRAESRTAEWFDHREDRFAEFKKRYLLEPQSNPAVPELVSGTGKREATLLYTAHDEAINHAVVLVEYGRARSRRRAGLLHVHHPC
jgi:uncharacterized protein YeaO (DUF488 family)